MKICVLAFIFVSICCLISCCYGADRQKKVLLVSFDGFRWDYFKKTTMQNFELVKKEGVSVKYMTPPFTTVTFPCHYTLVTGMYEENHGIVGNSIWDPKFKAKFGMKNHETRWWDGAEPIWITARKNQLNSGTYFWPGSEVMIDNLRPTFCKKYNYNTPWKQRVDTVIDWLSNRDVSLATLYLNQPDHTGHKKGPNSQDLIDTLKLVDADLGYLLDQIKAAGLNNTLDLIIVSDHGMAEINKDVIFLSEVIDISWLYETAQAGAVFHLWPVEGKDKELIEALDQPNKPWTFYRKADIPDDWHYKNNRRIPPYILVAKEGYLVYATKITFTYKGNHGYDNGLKDMRAIFLAKGPSFKSNYKKETIHSVDIYPMICKILNMKCKPVDGTLAATKEFLIAGSATRFSSVFKSILVIYVILLTNFQ